MKAILPNPAYALDFRLKSPESLLRKIETDSMVKGISVSEAAADIGDALRYTMILPEESFSQSVMSTLNHLDASGAQILKLKNTFVEGASYKGINSNFLTAEGQVVELQFHTEPSFAVKQANHVEYEEARLASTSAERRLALEAQMQASAHGVTLPPGVDAVRLDRVGVPNTGAVRFTGAGTTTTDALAESTYDQIRALKMSDIGTISESTGLSISEATTLKKHLFFGKHSLPVGSPDGVTFQLSRFTADDELAFAWQRAQKGNLSQSQQDWFRQLADHELAERQFMAQGVPYRNPQSYNPQTGFGQIPPGAHDMAPPPAPYGTFPGFYDWLLKNAF